MRVSPVSEIVVPSAAVPHPPATKDEEMASSEAESHVGSLEGAKARKFLDEYSQSGVSSGFSTSMVRSKSWRKVAIAALVLAGVLTGIIFLMKTFDSHEHVTNDSGSVTGVGSLALSENENDPPTIGNDTVNGPDDAPQDGPMVGNDGNNSTVNESDGGKDCHRPRRPRPNNGSGGQRPRRRCPRDGIDGVPVR